MITAVDKSVLLYYFLFLLFYFFYFLFLFLYVNIYPIVKTIYLIEEISIAILYTNRGFYRVDGEMIVLNTTTLHFTIILDLHVCLWVIILSQTPGPINQNFHGLLMGANSLVQGEFELRPLNVLLLSSE